MRYAVLQFLTFIFRRFGKISVFNIETNNKAVKKQIDIQTRQMLGEVIEVNLNYLVRFATVRIGSKTYAEDVVHEAVLFDFGSRYFQNQTRQHQDVSVPNCL